MIKKRLWDEKLIVPESSEKTVKVFLFEDFFIRIEEKNGRLDKVLILGHDVIDLTKFNILEFLYQKMNTEQYIKSYNVNKDIYEYKNNNVYIVSIMTIESLMSFKYTESLNLISFAFENESVALMFLKTLEDLRFRLKEEKIKEISKETEDS